MQLEQLLSACKKDERPEVFEPLPKAVPRPVTRPVDIQMYIDIAEKARLKAERLERENLEVRVCWMC